MTTIAAALQEIRPRIEATLRRLPRAQVTVDDVCLCLTHLADGEVGERRILGLLTQVGRFQGQPAEAAAAVEHISVLFAPELLILQEARKTAGI